jgi:aspartate aminotransferase-like enzyme
MMGHLDPSLHELLLDLVEMLRAVLDEHGIEISGGLGPDSPSMWRIGLLGPNASIEIADRVLAAFDKVLAHEGRSHE